MASYSGCLVGARLLVERGAHVDAVGAKGRQPLHDAALEGHPEVMRFLLKCGADPKAEANFGETPLDESLERVRPHHDLSAKIEGIALMLQLGCEPRAELAQYPLLKKARKTLTPTGDESAKSTKPGTPLEQLVAEFSGPLPAPYRKLLPQSSADGLYGVEQALKELRYWREEHDIAEDLVPLGDNGLGDIWFLNLTSGEVSEWLHEESRWQTVAPTLGRFLTRLRRSRGSP